MPRTYFEPENFQALARVFEEARLILEKRNEADPATLDFVAHRIFALASNGMTPALILANVLNTKIIKSEGETRSCPGARQRTIRALPSDQAQI